MTDPCASERAMLQRLYAAILHHWPRGLAFDPTQPEVLISVLATHRVTKLVGIVQRLQPAGSPIGGGPVELVEWIVRSVQAQLDAVTAENARLRDRLLEVAAEASSLHVEARDNLNMTMERVVEFTETICALAAEEGRSDG